MSGIVRNTRAAWPIWAARVAVAVVCAWNLSAAFPFTLAPARYAPAFEVIGAGGEALVRGMGILFLMWQVPFLPVIRHPRRHRACFRVILAMQAIGLAGETWMLATLVPGHEALRATGMRFVAFDAAGLALLAAAYALARRAPAGRASGPPTGSRSMA
ncbi:MAG: hypothetical protein H5T65_00220 [Chloroflexi bacterium]|nr:hypothetical protein [Chloroflexota bacterium]